MAYLTTRHLKNRESEDFLKSRGFTLVPSIAKSLWLSYAVQLSLDEGTIICDDLTLYKIIYETGYFDGEAEGKIGAVAEIQAAIYNMVFPQKLKNVDNEPTIA